MKALITGAAGFIGSHLTSALLDRGAEVTGLDCFTDYYPREIKMANLAVNADRPGFRFVEGSIQHTDLAALLEGKTVVFHLAAQAGVRKSWGRDFRIYTDNNVDAIAFTSQAQVQRLVELAKRRRLDTELRTGLEKTKVAAVGPVVAAALTEAGFRVDTAPTDSYSMKPLVTSLCELLERRP